MIDELMKTLAIQTTGRDNLYTLSYRSTEPDKARRVVQSLVSIFVESSLGGKRKDSDSAKKFIDDQIKNYEKKLEEAEGRLKEFKLRNIALATADGKDYYGRVGDISTQLEPGAPRIARGREFARRIEAPDPRRRAGAAARTGALGADGRRLGARDRRPDRGAEEEPRHDAAALHRPAPRRARDQARDRRPRGTEAADSRRARQGGEARCAGPRLDQQQSRFTSSSRCRWPSPRRRSRRCARGWPSTRRATRGSRIPRSSCRRSRPSSRSSTATTTSTRRTTKASSPAASPPRSAATWRRPAAAPISA